MQKFVSYLRVSTARQGEQGLGIDAQREAVRRHVESVGGLLVEEHVEVETGKSHTRPVLLGALAQCRSQKAVLLIARIDRLARSVSFISSLMDGGVDFVAADMPAANRLMLHMLAAFAEFEREQIAARTKAALAAARARGVQLGRHGAVLAAKHRQDADDFAETMREPVLVAMKDGAGTLSAIANRLNESGHLAREGGNWTMSTTQKLLRRLCIRTDAMPSSRPTGEVCPGA